MTGLAAGGLHTMTRTLGTPNSPGGTQSNGRAPRSSHGVDAFARPASAWDFGVDRLDDGFVENEPASWVDADDEYRESHSPVGYDTSSYHLAESERYGRGPHEAWETVSPWTSADGRRYSGEEYARDGDGGDPYAPGPRYGAAPRYGAGDHGVRDLSEEIPHPIDAMAGRWARSPIRLWMFLLAVALTAIALPRAFASSDGPRSVEIASESGGEAVGPTPAETPGAAARDSGGGGDSDAVASSGSQGIDQPTAGLATQLLSRFGGVRNDAWGDGNLPRRPRSTSTMVQQAMCSVPTVGDADGSRCGTGWLSQPLVAPIDNDPALIFGGYDAQLHFVGIASAAEVRQALPMGSPVVGALAVDPDGFPLVYAGTEQGKLSIIALDRGNTPEVLWTFDLASDANGLWSNSWSGAPLVVEDHLIVGAGNGRLYSFALGRTNAKDGKVSVAPQLVHSLQTWNDDLLAQIPDRRIGVAGGVTLIGTQLFMANEGGRVLGWNLADLLVPGEPKPVFRWTAPDVISAPLAAGPDGSLLVSVARDRRGPADNQIGSVVKLDPANPANPMVWAAPGDESDPSGSVSTPLSVGDWVISTTENGVISGYDQASGAHVWSLQASGPLRSSPILQGNSLLVADCSGRVTHFDLRTNPPTKRWSARVGGCVESTPTVWTNSVFVSTTDGFVHRLADRAED